MIIWRANRGAQLIVALKGRRGPLAIGVPADAAPGLPQDGGIELAITSGGTYCVAFGGAAGGRIRSGPRKWSVHQPTNAGSCPLP